MKVYELRGPGLDSLVQAERPEPQPSETQLVVRMRAASLNYRDLLVATDRYGRGPIPFPLVPLSDGAGEVLRVGSRVTRFQPGERVLGNFFQKWEEGPFDSQKAASALGGAIDGVLAEEVALEESGAAHVPNGLSFEEAATLPCAGLTAWVGLVRLGKLAATDTVLAMGTGGVSIFALQIGKAVGAKVILTSSHDEKLARGRELGADESINYRETTDWDAQARALTGGDGVDQLLEVGGAATLPRSLAAVRPGGHLCLVGLLSGSTSDRGEAAKNQRGVRVDSVYVGSTQDLREFCAFIEKYSLRPVIDRAFSFDEARGAYDYLQKQAHFGKVVIRL
ncbi:MAG TPA: NAD(P)-dependent alcohol dehydrogenase [Polyangiaceae bacterium]|nr:NAD(P)-dependent alcohol dehydrogenase [Polyangiaceae bacterium]